MFHKLHCLEKMRIFLDDPSRKDVGWGHQQHCMNYLRQVVLCRGDLTLETLPIDVELELERMKGLEERKVGRRRWDRGCGFEFGDEEWRRCGADVCGLELDL